MSDQQCMKCGAPWAKHLRVKGLAAGWQVHPCTIRRLIRLGELDAVQLGLVWHICGPSVDHYIREHSNFAERASA